MKILFVCTGNICRSPTAEGVFRAMAEAAGVAFEADSAGTHGYHIGDAPDPRTVAAAAKRGFDLSPLKARRVRREDFDVFDLILAMDRDHLEHLSAMKPERSRADVKLYLDYHPRAKGGDVPDPYYGGAHGFEHVLDLVEETSKAILATMQKP